MLKSWGVENFKAILSSGKLPLAPVTVLAGMNSSGKSSLLQSILVIAQTFGSSTLNRALLPNGLLIQLGKFEDILHRGANSRSVIVDFEIDFSQDAGNHPESETSDEDYFSFEDIGFPAHKVCISARFSRDAIQTGLFANDTSSVLLDHLSLHVDPAITVTIGDSLFGAFKLILSRIDENRFADFAKNITSSYSRLIPRPAEKNHYIAELYQKIDNEGIEEEEQVLEECIVSLSHFIPDHILQKFNIREEQEENIRTILWLLGRRDTGGIPIPAELVPVHYDTDGSIPADFKRLVQERFPEEVALSGFPYETIHELYRWPLDLGEMFDKERVRAILKACVEAYCGTVCLDKKGPVLRENSAVLEKRHRMIRPIDRKWCFIA